MGVAPCFRYASLRPNMFERAYCYRTSIFFIINCYFILIAMSAINSAEWYALVKYKSDNTTEIVPLCKIKVKVGKGLRIPFKPKSLTDFDKTAFYAVNTARGSNDGKEHKWYALIGLLADSREALEHAMNVKRISWPNMYSHDESSEPNTTDDALERARPCNFIIASNRDSIRNKKKSKTDAINAIHAKLLSSRSLSTSPRLVTTEPSTSVSDTDRDTVTLLLRENEELRFALQKEREQSNSPGEVTDYINILENYLQEFNEKIDKMQEILHSAGKVNEDKFAGLENKITNIENLTRMRPLSSAANSTATVLSDTEEKIPLGDGVFCSKAAYKELISVEESHADWAYALLKGVFGEKAHLMRMRIKNKNTANERFSSNFLMVAKAMHRDWLAQQNIRNENGQLSSKYSSTEIERYVNALPAYLADRAYDMLGPRGINAKRKNGENVERRQNNLTKKRKYTRRGQPLVELQQPLQQEPMQHQSLQQEPLQQEPLQYQTPWQQIPQQHSSQQQSLQQEPLQHQSPRQQIPQQHSSQQQSLQQEPLQQEPLQHQSPRQQIPQHHPSQQQSLQQEPLQHQPPQQYQPFRFDFPPTASEPETLENFSPFATYSSL